MQAQPVAHSLDLQRIPSIITSIHGHLTIIFQLYIYSHHLPVELGRTLFCLKCAERVYSHTWLPYRTLFQLHICSYGDTCPFLDVDILRSWLRRKIVYLAAFMFHIHEILGLNLDSETLFWLWFSVAFHSQMLLRSFHMWVVGYSVVLSISVLCIIWW